MKEFQELKIRKALLDFINKEVQINASTLLTPEQGIIAISDRKYELVNLLFGLVEEFNKYLEPPELDTNIKDVV